MTNYGHAVNYKDYFKTFSFQAHSFQKRTVKHELEYQFVSGWTISILCKVCYRCLELENENKYVYMSKCQVSIYKFIQVWMWSRPKTKQREQQTIKTSKYQMGVRVLNTREMFVKYSKRQVKS